MNSKIAPRSPLPRRGRRKGSNVKTASIATLGSLPRKNTRGPSPLLKYLPHATIVVVLLALLLAASRSAPGERQPAQPETHMGQHQ
jgi:hypothetical protein